MVDDGGNNTYHGISPSVLGRNSDNCNTSLRNHPARLDLIFSDTKSAPFAYQKKLP